MLKTIKGKFIFFSIIMIILSVGIPNYFLIQQFQTNFRERSEIYLDSVVDMILFNLKNSMKERCSKQILQLIDNMKLNENVNHIRIFNSDGKVLYSSEHNDINKNIRNIAPNHIDSSFTQIKERRISLTDDYSTFTAFQSIKNDHECQSCHEENKAVIAYMDVDTHLTSAEKKFYTGVQHFVYLGFVLIILLAFGLIVLFNYFINKPLLEISGAIDKLEKGDFDLQLPIRRDDEFGKLNNHFNKMVNELKLSREKIEELHLEQLRRADKMVTLGEIAAAMAHDINNHSAIIMTRADYLQMQMESVDSVKYSDEINVIIDQVNKISKTTGNILKNTKKISSEFTDINLKKLVYSILSNLEPLLKKKEVTLESNMTEGETIIRGNIEKIEQVVMNLVNNALDALDKKGKIIVSVTRSDEDEIKLTIQDNGKGISFDDIEKIYSPFFTTKTNEKGTGLGLYIVKKICKNHDAEIECNSFIGKGTVFTITFKSEQRK